MSNFLASSKRLNDIFADDIQYNIPEFQRPYSWTIKDGVSDGQVQQLWSDILNSFERKGEKRSYFLGSMVVISSEDSPTEYDVVDGQQRLTTLTLFFAALKLFLIKVKDNQPEYANMVIQGAIPMIDKLLFNQKTKGFQILKTTKIYRREMLDEIDPNIYFKKAVEGEDIEKEMVPSKQKKVLERYFQVVSFFQKAFKSYFLQHDKLSTEKLSQLQELVEFVKNSIYLVQIVTKSIETAYFIFETLNYRGLPLQNKDLLRNFLMKEFATQGFSNPNARWGLLENRYNIADEFITTFLTSKTGDSLRNTFPFNSLMLVYRDHYSEDIYEGKKKIEVFYEDFERNLRIYNSIINEEFKQSATQYRLRCLKILGSENVYPMLLALFRYAEDYEISESDLNLFLKRIEQYFLYFAMKPSVHLPKEVLKKIINLLNTSGGFSSCSSELQLENQQKLELAQMLSQEILDHEIAKFLLAKYLWFKNLKNYSVKGKDDIVEQHIFMESATLEHIIPQRPAHGSNWLKFPQSFRDIYTYRLGNMTLLTKGDNSSAKNSDWERKKIVYEKTSLAFTNSLVNADLSVSFFQNRHQLIVSTLFEDLELGRYEVPATESFSEPQQITAKLTPAPEPEPEPSHPPIQENELTVALQDMEWEEPTGAKPIYLVFLGKKVPVKSWRDVWIQGLYSIYEKFPLKYPLLFEEERLKNYFSSNQYSLASTKPIPSPNEKKKQWFAETGRSASWLVLFLKIALEVCGVPLTSASIVYRKRA